MQVRLLGPVELWDGAVSVPLGPRARAVLAALALDPGRVRSVDRLIEAVWGERAPTTATAQIQACVSALRRAWRLADPDGEPVREVIVTVPPGYVLRTDQVDLLEFERHIDHARGMEPARAADELRAALALWRGPALGGLAGLAAEAARLEERRLTAIEERIDADLAVGRAGDLIPEVVSLVAAHPLRERFRGQLMRALHRAGRRSEALDAYQDARETLVAELGLEPGPDLRRIQQAILADDTSPAGPAPEPVPSGRPSPLPPDIADFTGRAKQVAEIAAALTWRPEPYAAVPIIAISGRGGVGKTTLAVHVAHRLRQEFPDGRLYVGLHGSEATPADPGDVLGRLLRALGVDGAAIPADPDERADLYRARLDGRRALIVLDNAADERQVRPLLPGSPLCAVLVTSRRRLTGLAGATRIELDAFDPIQAAELLTRVAGPERVAAEPEAADRVAALCDRLPLALRIAAARLAAKPHWTLDRLARRLADEHRRLDELVHADLEVRGSLALGHRGLSAAAQRAFRLLGVLEVADFAAWTAAALVDVPMPEGEDLVEELVDARLLEVAGRDETDQPRYRFHDLLRVYARERAVVEETPAERRAALGRAAGAWLALVGEAERRLPNCYYAPLSGDAPRTPLDPETTDVLLRDPLAWFESERSAITAMVEQAHAAGMPGPCWELASASLPFFEFCGDLVEWRRCCDHALAAARESDDLRGEAASEINLGAMLYVQSEFGEARDHFERAAALCERIGERYGRAGALCGVAGTVRIIGDPEASRPLWADALRLFGELGDRRAEAYAVEGLGLCDLDQGRAEPARARFEEMLRLYRSAGNGMGEAHALRRIAGVELELGRYGEALRLLEQALPTFHAIGDRLSEAVVRMRMGECLVRQKRHDEARPVLDLVMTTFRDVGWRTCEGHVLRLTGEMLLADGDPDAAAAQLGESLRIFRDLHESLDVAETLRCLADTHAAKGDAEAATAARDEAHGILVELGREL
ncbi:tetratricopeptide repeat protein [Actinoallomurus sp. NBC_01490]|uniref:AfsR/SARP family transcriptional regulator n=1 Tax=Actinoallomurus sp. NBC_01490 TaxID=2903557 RepID=UPI002E327DA4|nr:BTAD domain-containing putative transcriptional regulator [Actinoallomurus sp. NBC_01490]